MAPDGGRRERKKERERELLGMFFDDLGGSAWTLVRECERPDFLVTYGGQPHGIEVTELLARESGRERAGEGKIATVVCDVVGRVLAEHGGCGAIVDGHVRDLPRRRNELVDLPDRLAEHLARHGAPLAQDGGVMIVPFTHEYGAVVRVQRRDALGTVHLFADPAHQTTSADRQRLWLEEQLIVAVETKVGKAGGYDRTHRLWLVVRNPYTHLPDISEETRRRITALNAGTFERIYCHNLKMNRRDANRPRPAVLTVLSPQTADRDEAR